MLNHYIQKILNDIKLLYFRYISHFDRYDIVFDVEFYLGFEQHCRCREHWDVIGIKNDKKIVIKEFKTESAAQNYLDTLI